jgi:L-asparaginase
MNIHFIQTGGSIDKDYPRISESYAFEISSPAYKRILSRLTDVNFEYTSEELLQKDSMDITNEDRDLILKSCQNTKSDKIIITHGTDTMVDTAKVISVIKDKTIVIVGSMIPEMFVDTDAHFNIGMAVAGVELLPFGVYICMNGQFFNWDNVIKDKEQARFVSL